MSGASHPEDASLGPDPYGEGQNRKGASRPAWPTREGAEFFCEKLKVSWQGAPQEGETFTWRGKEYEIRTVLTSWREWRTPATVAHKSWRTRRHRNFYHIRTHSGETFEIFLDRTNKAKPEWFLRKRLS
ncbi:MAG: hypothetical protein AMS15_00550 [Planctomycetes bacterium DG_23]|nr:MAG: hypothetical protein AMS15_00550 [Planctomycetes bacterium DG_23]